MKKIISSLVIVAAFACSTTTFALTDPAIKEQQLWVDLFLESPSLLWTPPTWLQPTTLENASEDPYYWINQVLPYEQDRNHDIYMVIPQLWSVMPIIQIPEWSADYELMKSWWQIDINKYLVGGSLEYVSSVAPWNRWKRVDFAHSNNFRSSPGRYNNIFANLMALDPNDQVWYFVKWSDGEFDLFKYVVEKSYNTSPTNVQALLRDGDGADALIFWCTHWLDGRWMIEATYMWDPVWSPVPIVDPYENMSTTTRSRINNWVNKLARLPKKYKKYQIIQLFRLMDRLKWRANDEQLLIIEYLEQKLADIYPEE
jgi:hypothetical protein